MVFRHLEQMASLTGEVIWVTDRDRTTLRYISPLFERIWHRTVASLDRTPSRIHDAVHPDDRAATEAALDRARGAAFAFSYRIVWPDGTLRWIEERHHPVYDVDGNVESILCAARDITEVREVLAERDGVVERFQLMSRAMNEGMWDWDVVANRAWYSEQMYTVFGIDRATVPSVESWSQRVHPDDRERVIAGFRRVVSEAKETWADEYRYVRPDGVVLEVSDRGFAMFDSARRPVRIVGVVMDMTHQRALERQLRQAQKMEAVGQLAGGIAHDFNNMLQVVALEVGLLQSLPEVTSRVDAHLAVIRSAVDRARSLTRQLLVFSRREAMQQRSLDLDTKVRELARMLTRVLGDPIELVLDLAPEHLIVHADPSMLDQVILNISVNARDAMPAGGTLSIATALHADLDRPGRPRGDFACIVIRDTGVGIAPEVMPRIFDPFFTTKDAHGTGLGLATAHGIVEQHGGWIEVESELGAGTTFRVFLPAQGLESTADAPAVSALERPGTETILLVEDDDSVRCALAALLEGQGYEIVEADSGPAAIAAWEQRTGRIDLLVTDLTMPGGLNGCELADRLRASTPSLPVLVLTGHARDHGSQYRILHKPVEVEVLLAEVRAALDARAAIS